MFRTRAFASASAALLATLLMGEDPAHAWEARSDKMCSIRHTEESAKIEVTYDPALLEYAIALTLSDPWPDGGIFSLRFDGPEALTISTGRHQLSDAGRTLTVRDRGFGNVLKGLEFNDTATGMIGVFDIVQISLDGAAPAVQAFRTCAEGVST